MSFLQGDSKNASYGLTLLRVVTGLILLQAGYSKVFIYGFDATAQSFRGMGMFLPQITGPFVALLELVGGAALTLGIWPRYLGGLFAAQFVVATYAKVFMWNKGLMSARIDILLIAVCLLLATNGAGALNLGQLLKKGN